jgi:amino acid permease
MKLCFATGVLAIPSAFSIVGYGPGVILLVLWGALTTCKFISVEPQDLT